MAVVGGIERAGLALPTRFPTMLAIVRREPPPSVTCPDSQLDYDRESWAPVNDAR